MHKYNVYKHPVLGYEVIKQGFSWPGFFFTWIWAFVKKLWVQGGILIPTVLICNSIPPAMLDAWDGHFLAAIVGLGILIAPMYVTGKVGNKWRENSMLGRGYQLECTVPANSPEGALAEATKPTPKTTEEVSWIQEQQEKLKN